MRAPGKARRREFYGRHGPTYVDYALAERLRMSVEAVRALPADEYVGWHDWYDIRAKLGDLERRTQVNRAGH